ncbi:MAG: hypothetical protein ACI8UD_004059, partial [Planctomycetota bacterium]
ARVDANALLVSRLELAQSCSLLLQRDLTAA